MNGTYLCCHILVILVLEVYQFARDAAVAEGWLMAQESYLMSHELGVRRDRIVMSHKI